MKYENLITGIQQYEDRKQMFEKYAPEVDKRTTQNIKR
jgi:hypothetical protein